MTDRPCPICGHTGHSTQEGVAQCRRARETAGFGDRGKMDQTKERTKERAVEPLSDLKGQHIFRVELRGASHPDDLPILYTGDQLKGALDFGVVLSATLVGRVASS